MKLRAKFAFSMGLLGLLCLMLTGSLRADTVYTYTSNAYTDCVGTYCTGGPYALSVTFDVKAGTPLDSLPTDTDISADVTSFSFTDNNGLSITPANLIYGSDQFYVGTDASGNITTWCVVAQGSDPSNPNYLFNAFSYSPNPPAFGPTTYYADESQVYEPLPSFSDIGIGWNENLPSTWTMTTTPEPSGLPLLGIGLLGLLALAARSRRHAPPTSC